MAIGASAEGRRSPGNGYKVVFWVLFGANVLVLVSVTLGVLGYLYLFSSSAEQRELERSTSPDGAYDAVLLVNLGTGGATTGVVFELYVVEAGEEAVGLPYSQRVLLAESLGDDPKLQWKDERILEIGYQSAEISQFRNVLPSHESSRDTSEYVEVQLAPPESGSGLPEKFLDEGVVEATSPE